MLVGISPTLGRVSRYGVVPITADQDRPGPLARTVTDAAILLGALEGAAPDTNDPQTKRCAPPPGRDYTAYLKADGLKGARLGVPRAWFVEPHQLPGREKPEGGGPPDQTAMLNEAIAVLKARGAIIVDPADIPTVTTQDHTRNIVTWERCFGPDGFRGKDDHCAYTIKYGMKRDFNAWLASLGTAAPVRTLTELRQWNKTHEAAGSMKYGQGLIDLADEPNLETDKARYDTDRARDLRLVGPEGFDAVAKEHKLDAFVLIGSRGVNLLSKPGYPAVTVPFGLVANGGNWPAGWEPKPMPMGITFAGTACTDPRLIEIAYSFEQATRRRRPPDL
jgi:amidase